MRKIHLLTAIMIVVGGASICGGLFLGYFYSRPFFAIAIAAFVIAAALFIMSSIVRRTTIWFWLVVGPLLLLVCSSFGVLAENYILDRSKEPGVSIQVKGFMGYITPTAARFYVDFFIRNDSAYKVSIDRIAYEVYYSGNRLCSAERTDTVTIEEKYDLHDYIEVVADDFSEETSAFLYERLKVNRGSLPLQITGSIQLRYGSITTEKPFEATYTATSIDGGIAIKLENIIDCT